MVSPAAGALERPPSANCSAQIEEAGDAGEFYSDIDHARAAVPVVRHAHFGALHRRFQQTAPREESRCLERRVGGLCVVLAGAVLRVAVSLPVQQDHRFGTAKERISVPEICQPRSVIVTELRLAVELFHDDPGSLQRTRKLVKGVHYGSDFVVPIPEGTLLQRAPHQAEAVDHDKVQVPVATHHPDTFPLDVGNCRHGAVAAETQLGGGVQLKGSPAHQRELCRDCARANSSACAERTSTWPAAPPASAAPSNAPTPAALSPYPPRPRARSKGSPCPPSACAPCNSTAPGSARSVKRRGRVGRRATTSSPVPPAPPSRAPPSPDTSTPCSAAPPSAASASTTSGTRRRRSSWNRASNSSLSRSCWAMPTSA